MKKQRSNNAPLKMKKKSSFKMKNNFFEKFSAKVTRIAGSTSSFFTAAVIVLVWLVTGPLFHYSDTWQLIINTGTTIVTFLMVFLIQKSQNKDSLAIQLKLNELVASHELSSNRLVDVEDLTEEELIVIRKYYARLAEMAKKDTSIHQSHSLDEAEIKHHSKLRKEKEDEQV